MSNELLPEGIPSWQLPYWDALNARRLSVQQCRDCGLPRHIPKEICSRCHGVEWDWVPVSGDGEVYTYTIVRRAPTPQFQSTAPYVLVHAQMVEGFRVVARLVGVEPEDVEIGMPLRADYERLSDEWTALVFRAA